MISNNKFTENKVQDNLYLSLMAFSWCFFHTLRPQDKTFTLSWNETNAILQHLLNTFPFQGNGNIPKDT
jgi:hypothetical protein